jgi:hypothetical protein
MKLSYGSDVEKRLGLMAEKGYSKPQLAGGTPPKEYEMRSVITYSVGFFVLAASPALANESVFEATKNPKNWAMQQGDYSNHRYS